MLSLWLRRTMSGRRGSWNRKPWRREERSRDRNFSYDGSNRGSGRWSPLGRSARDVGAHEGSGSWASQGRSGRDGSFATERRKRYAEDEEPSRGTWSSEASSQGTRFSKSEDGPRGRGAFQRGGGSRRGQGRPPGLRGKEIGLYYRDMARKKKEAMGNAPKVCKYPHFNLDSRKEAEIRGFLNSIGVTVDKELGASSKQSGGGGRSKFVEEREFYDLKKAFLSEASISGEEQERGGRESYDGDDAWKNVSRIKRDPDEKSAVELSGSAVVKMEEDEEEEKEREGDEPDNWEDEVCEPILGEKVEQVKELVSDLEDLDGMGMEDLMPPPTKAALLEKYRHLGDSAFKKKFLQCITGSIQERLAQSLLCRTSLDGDPALDLRLREELLEKQSNAHYKRMLKFRQQLPAHAQRKEILDIIEGNQVCLIRGETGCGKTTQVAQFILDQHIESGKGSRCHVVCTQPRRISAISVAERVADERAERLGHSTGYQIRLERIMPNKCGSMLFCTTGILLQTLQGDPALSYVSHLVLDEIHERDTQSDFVLTIVKDVMKKRPDLRVILMSATLDSLQFSKYFNNCPHLEIPGFTYPVKEYYLEDIIQMTKYQTQKPEGDSRSYKKFLKQARINRRAMEKYQEFIQPYIKQLRSERRYPDWVLEELESPESEGVCIELVLELIKYICHTQSDGAILVFLPGWDKISSLNRLMTESHAFPSSQYVIIPLHSLMPTTTQKSIFNRPPPGVRKIVLSTNIAETSITIDDVVYVIDAGKTKMQNFDLEQNIATLQAEWISKANAKQRRGRAGRVQPGVCYHTYTHAREEVLANYPLPEMMRTRLEEVILQIKILQLGDAVPFLERVLDPPDPRAVDLALKLLKGMNALDEEENLTPLGFHLARLPLDPRTGKMILLGAIFSCIEPVFSIAASLNFKDAFLIPMDKEEEVNRVKNRLSGGVPSDHWVIAEAMRQWEAAERRNNGNNFCWQYFLSRQTLGLLRDMKGQFAQHLHEMNFLKTTNPKDPDANRNSGNVALVKAIVCAGLYPNVAILHRCRQLRNGMVKKKLTTPEDGSVQFHPKSLIDHLSSFRSSYFMYHQKLKSSAIFLHDGTLVNPMMLLLFGKHCQLGVEDGAHVIHVSQGINFQCLSGTGLLIKALREELLKLLEHKIAHPGTIDWSHGSREGNVLRTIIELIAFEDEHMQAPESSFKGRREEEEEDFTD